MLTGYIRGQELRISTPEIAADSIKYLEAEFHFAGRDWDGYVKTAYFINGASKFALVLADDRITADMGLNLTAGEWEVKLSGVKGDSRITTTTEHIYVREFGGTEGTLPDVTPTQAEQLLAKIGDMSALETEAKDSLVAAINEVAKSGGGSGGKDGTGIESITYKGEDEYGGNMYTVLLTDGTSYDITAPKGAAGAAGVTPHIGDNGNWYLGTTDTGKPSRGEKGEDAAADLTLGLTGATVGQIAKITAVDASGVPTAWSPVDMPSGGGGETWEKLVDTSLAESVEAVTYTFDNCKSLIALIAPVISASVPGWKRFTINSVVYPAFNNSLQPHEGICFRLDSKYPPYLQANVNTITNTVTYGLAGGVYTAGLENIVANGVTQFGCQTAAILTAGTKIEIWGMK